MQNCRVFHGIFYSMREKYGTSCIELFFGDCTGRKLYKGRRAASRNAATLSRQIAQLEEELGVELFVRSNHNIILTEEGMILKRRAQEILSLADKTKRDLLHKAENLEGTISIGSGEFLATRYLTDCIAEFCQKFPLDTL